MPADMGRRGQTSSDAGRTLLLLAHLLTHDGAFSPEQLAQMLGCRPGDILRCVSVLSDCGLPVRSVTDDTGHRGIDSFRKRMPFCP